MLQRNYRYFYITGTVRCTMTIGYGLPETIEKILTILSTVAIGLMFVSYAAAQGQVVTQDERELLNTPASLRCSLQTDKEVLLVTWQKIKATSPENIATFSKRYGVVVQPPYKDRVNITQLDLTNSTLTFWNTTNEDEGCFMCLFNTFGSGKISGKTCLTLYVPPTTSLHTDGLNITCSATARPAPVIFWKAAGSGIDNSTKNISNPNGTTTVTSILQVKDPKSQVGNEEVICKVLHLGTVTDLRQTLSNGHEITLTTTSIAVVVVVVIILIVIFCYNWRRRHRDGNTFHAL
uniref:Glycoprotein vOX2-1 n=1 Tax=Elephant endotheliotropic herpesvirus 1A TaxID=759753 RepID=A0A2H5CA15_ELHV1|nr:glycoprotein vOX2-1 [Elephant endotheliotropic herpesvirus 1A]AYF58417.1 glycoprotein vOX2-1 [Elephant endotheliotropic herpesvirus 1A]